MVGQHRVSTVPVAGGAGNRLSTVEGQALPRDLADPAILPTGLSVRFLALMLLIFASTAAIYGHIAVLSDPGTPAAESCLSAEELARLAGITVAQAEQLRDSALMTLACTRALAGGLALWGGLGVMIVGVTAWLLYLLTPLWKIRFGNRLGRVLLSRLPGRSRIDRLALRPLLAEHPELSAGLDELLTRAGLARPPTFWLDPVRNRDSITFGWRRRPHIRLRPSVVEAHATDPVRFDGIVLHELAHMRNRDNWPTYATIACRRAFLVLAVVPYVVSLISPRLFADPLRWRPSDIQPLTENVHTVLATLTLIAMVFLTSQAVLRSRELHADATAGQYDDGMVGELLGRGDPPRATRWWSYPLQTHPTVRQRRAALANPVALYAPDAIGLFGVGLAVSLLTADFTLLVWSALLASPFGAGQPAFLLVVALISVVGFVAAAIIAALAGVSMWRARLAATVSGARPPTILLALALVSGLLVGEPLSATGANANVWGIFDGVGAAGPAGSVISAATLVLLTVALFQWTHDNAAAWIPVRRRLLRRACGASIVVGALALWPLYTVWWLYHDQPAVALLEIWTPGLATKAGDGFWPGPGAGFIEAMYLPANLAMLLPGVGVLVALPGLAFALGALRRPRSVPLRFAVISAIAATLAFAVIGTGLALWFRWALGGDYIQSNAVQGSLRYTATAAVDLAGLIAAGVAVFVTRRGRGATPTLGVLAALVTATGAIVTAPVLISFALCGPARIVSCTTVSYGTIFGYVGLQIPVLGVLAAGVAIAAAAWLSALVHLPAQPPNHPQPANPIAPGKVDRAEPGGLEAAREVGPYGRMRTVAGGIAVAAVVAIPALAVIIWQTLPG
jgi:hypothetical protein